MAEDAKKNQNRVFRNLIPQVNLGYYYSMALFGEDDGMSGRSGEFDINIIFSLPELINLPIEYYTAALATTRQSRTWSRSGES